MAHGKIFDICFKQKTKKFSYNKIINNEEYLTNIALTL